VTGLFQSDRRVHFVSVRYAYAYRGLGFVKTNIKRINDRRANDIISMSRYNVVDARTTISSHCFHAFPVANNNYGTNKEAYLYASVLYNRIPNQATVSYRRARPVVGCIYIYARLTNCALLFHSGLFRRFGLAI